MDIEQGWNAECAELWELLDFRSCSSKWDWSGQFAGLRCCFLETFIEKRNLSAVDANHLSAVISRYLRRRISYMETGVEYRLLLENCTRIFVCILHKNQFKCSFVFFSVNDIPRDISKFFIFIIQCILIFTKFLRENVFPGIPRMYHVIQM